MIKMRPDLMPIQFSDHMHRESFLVYTLQIRLDGEKIMAPSRVLRILLIILMTGHQGLQRFLKCQGAVGEWNFNIGLI